MGIFKIIRNTDYGLPYMNNVLNYVCYGHTDYDKLYSLNTDVYNAYEQFLTVKRYFGKTSGNPVFHFVVVYNAKTTRGDNLEIAESISRSIAAYFTDRYQLVYCIHKKPRHKKNGGCASIYHAHFIMNSVSYIDGKMFSGNKSEQYAFLEYIKSVTGDKSWIVQYDSDKKKSYNSSYEAV
ncbi:MAG: relaxase/mobilization nuclease domain-containing protein [Oscillospiraceae bacterium]|nr:relaxase/mobilization nuclease domain-containing protein [Oscillospiraceae bacterium]